ncbi:hypothetical protein [Streptomyces ipomoeae]|uniref:hypothetical protein n=1 Tax=Streptomyces ipomoeae TaxID=103232 RepID=UPI001146FF3B|nr:hypothetical protein [Streptomyces ipomoeae]TQE33112.1 hypothetical protein Sipo7851_21685 [Streptomyces ipomoeae]
MPNQLAVIRRPVRAQTITRLLTQDGLQRRQKIGRGRTGIRQPRCSGFLTAQRTPVYVQVRYVHDAGDDDDASTRIETERHQHIQRLLERGGYTADIPDAPVAGNVGVHIRRLEEPTEAEWEALERIADGQVEYHAGDGSVSGVDQQTFTLLYLSDLATSRRTSSTQRSAQLTPAGASLLAALATLEMTTQ